MSWKKDKDFTNEVIGEVREDGDYWTIGLKNGLHFSGIKREKDKPAPRLGATVRMFGGSTWGGHVRGVVMDPTGSDPVVYYYKTETEHEVEMRSEAERGKNEKKEKFLRDREDMDRRVEALPPVFRQRIEFFRSNCKDFRWEFEPYELFVCEEAIKIASALAQTDPIDLDLTEVCARFSLADPKTQRKMVPALSEEHSGNTFGCASALARAYLLKPDRVFQMHGAMTPLVGCKEYGCLHPRGHGGAPYA